MVRIRKDDDIVCSLWKQRGGLTSAGSSVPIKLFSKNSNYKRDDIVQETGIYCIENSINNKKYIGQSVDIYDRWSHHRSDLNNGTHDNEYLQRSWDKYGSDNFNFYVLEFCDIDKLDEREVYFIDFYQTLNRDKGYNLISGGSFGKKYSQETKDKMSKSLLGHIVSGESRRKISQNHADVRGVNNPMYGKGHTNDAKDKISKANKGRISSKRNHNNVYCVELDKIFDDATFAGKELNLDSSGILKCCRK